MIEHEGYALSGNWGEKLPMSDKRLIALHKPCPCCKMRNLSAAVLLNLSPAGLGCAISELRQITFELGYCSESNLEHECELSLIDFLDATDRLDKMAVPVALFESGDYEGEPLPQADKALLTSHKYAGHTPGHLVPLQRFSELSVAGMLYVIESICFQAWLFGVEAYECTVAQN